MHNRKAINQTSDLNEILSWKDNDLTEGSYEQIRQD